VNKTGTDDDKSTYDDKIDDGDNRKRAIPRPKGDWPVHLKYSRYLLVFWITKKT